jgi:hypothetical protein
MLSCLSTPLSFLEWVFTGIDLPNLLAQNGVFAKSVWSGGEGELAGHGVNYSATWSDAGATPSLAGRGHIEFGCQQRRSHFVLPGSSMPLTHLSASFSSRPGDERSLVERRPELVEG